MLYRLVNVKKEAPQIIRLEEPIRMIGVSLRTDARAIYKDAQTLGERYLAIKKAQLIRNKKEPWGFVAISKDFDAEQRWEYLMGDVVNDLQTIPDGLVGFEIPAGLYAKFTLQPRTLFGVAALWGLAMGLLKRYIYSEWLPSSNYVVNNVVVGDFEYHDQRSVAKKPEIDLYVSIKHPSEK